MHKSSNWAARRMKRTAIVMMLGALAGLMTTGSAFAQATWPTKPVRIIVSFPPGGAADVIARTIAQPLQEVLGQPVVVENRAGANGNIAGEFVAKSAADGYTFLMASGGMVSVNPHIYPRMSYDPNKDVVPVASAARVLVYLLANPSKVQAKNMKEFLAYMKANPGKLTYGSPGNGSSPHLSGEMMKSMTGTYAVHVPYRGAAPSLQDLLAGQIDFHFDPGVGLAHAKAGRLTMLAVGSMKRSAQFPDVPTLDESGLKGFDADTVFGFYAPAGTSAEIIARVNREINRILSTPAVVARIQGIGGEPMALTPQAFAEKAQQDSKRFGAIIRERKILGD